MNHNAYLRPAVFTIFGGTGDLAKTKLFPSLLRLYRSGELPMKFCIIGFSRKDFDDEMYQNFVSENLSEDVRKEDPEAVQAFLKHFRYVPGDFDDKDSFERVKWKISNYDTEIGQCTDKLFYLAVPPRYYDTLFDGLHASDALSLCDGIASWARLLVEKPFGRNLETSRALESKLTALFSEEQIYRIDHYLAKDAIENIIALRFLNTVLSDSWDSQGIESIHIKLLEKKDVSSRGAFYDSIGTLRDVGQNHMLQIFALLTMPPADIHDPVAIRTARELALKRLPKQIPEKIVRGQYTGYDDTKGVDGESETETYFKLEFTLDAQPWQGTKCTFEAGKALDRHENEAVITFRSLNLCHCSVAEVSHNHKNILRIRFEPNHQMSLSMWTKKPGYTFALREQELTLATANVEESDSPEAYERVLYDCISGNQTRFVSGPEVDAAWEFITPILERFPNIPLEKYAPGSVGPEVV